MTDTTSEKKTTSKTPATAPISIEARFAAAWADCENPPLDASNPHFRTRFASLKATLGVIRTACAKHGLAYRQAIQAPTGNTPPILISSLVDADGNTMPLGALIVDRPANPQTFGANLTYAKRQLAQVDWGITGDPDEDGRPTPTTADTANANATPPAVTPKLIAACTDVDKLRTWWQAHPDLQDLIKTRVAELNGGGNQ
nr:MAG TPA: ERF superfamily protein [Caudoviricetes sp.]